jgi:hypothetical protein
MRKAGKFDHLTYQGDVKIGELSTTQTWEARVAKGWYGVDTPLRKRTLVRLPVVPEQLGTRPLPDSAWGNLPAITRAALCILHAAMRTGEHLLKRLWAGLLDAYPTNNKMRKAVDKHLNPILGQLGMRKIATDPTSKPKVTFKLSLDGTAVENFIKDLFRGLVEHAPNAVKLWGLEQSRSKLLRAVTRTYKELGEEGREMYWALVEAIPMLTDYAIGMKSALKMRPNNSKNENENDYHLVEKHLALYTVRKALLWPGSLTWYDTSCLYTLGQMMRKWGSLRLVSQEGMEAVRRVGSNACRVRLRCWPLTSLE